MLGYAADTLRGAALTRARARRRAPVIVALLVVCLAIVSWDIWAIVQIPVQPLGYLRLAWRLVLVAYPASILAGSAVRVGARIGISSMLLATAASLWDAALAPGDWVRCGGTQGPGSRRGLWMRACCR
jgi:hypothetical protein